MKKVTILIILTLMLLVNTAGAQEITIPDEPMPTINKAREGDLLIHFNTRQGIVTIRKGFIQNETFFPVKEQVLLWADQQDNPQTEEDETSTEGTDFINAVLNKPALRAAVKAKLGVE